MKNCTLPFDWTITFRIVRRNYRSERCCFPNRNNGSRLGVIVFAARRERRDRQNTRMIIVTDTHSRPHGARYVDRRSFRNRGSKVSCFYCEFGVSFFAGRRHSHRLFAYRLRGTEPQFIIVGFQNNLSTITPRAPCPALRPPPANVCSRFSSKQFYQWCPTAYGSACAVGARARCTAGTLHCVTFQWLSPWLGERAEYFITRAKSAVKSFNVCVCSPSWRISNRRPR